MSTRNNRDRQFRRVNAQPIASSQIHNLNHMVTFVLAARNPRRRLRDRMNECAFPLLSVIDVNGSAALMEVIEQEKARLQWRRKGLYIGEVGLTREYSHSVAHDDFSGLASPDGFKQPRGGARRLSHRAGTMRSPFSVSGSVSR